MIDEARAVARNAMSARAAWMVVIAACGRVGFQPLADLTDAPPMACTVDSNCGSCARCQNMVCQAEPITDVELGHNSLCYIGAGGSRWCAGENTMGDLGLGDVVSPRPTPARNVGEDGWTALFLGVSASQGVRDGELWGWGFLAGGPNPVDDGSAAVIADVDYENNDCTVYTNGLLSCDPSHATWTYFAQGWRHQCGVQPGGSLWCWGVSMANNLGQGITADGMVITNPTQVGTDTDWIDVVAGIDFSCARKSDFTLWCWGDDAYTGMNFVDTGGVPLQVGTDTDWTWLQARWERACAGKGDGSVYCWGFGTTDPIVPGEATANVPVPTQLAGTFDAWRLGGHAECGHTAAGWECFGENDGGQLGIGTLDPVSDFVPLCGP